MNKVYDPSIDLSAPRTDIVRAQVSAEEWQARVELAACYRLAAKYGWTDLIYTHISVRVPGPQEHFLLNPFGYLFNELLSRGSVSSQQRRREAGYEPTPYDDGTFCNISGSPSCGHPGNATPGEASVGALKGPYDAFKLGLNVNPIGRGFGLVLDAGEIGYNTYKGNYGDAANGTFGVLTGKIVEIGMRGFAGASVYGREIVERIGGVTSWFAEKVYGGQPWRDPR
jgi:hypothetical protein